ncbi:response regulator transcription factor [Janthinobacterium sp. PC23-8]|uniref:response regulator transcription factor n=1 Tax=Janthinobacterium sp. PC23-8 TaxID=2012679 RepID=UPI000B976044|nr:response regulator [Janthinobacterium sp. PC23-8]OYO28103.1 DNA-binding response regulator [Janthinobacterium sp. PC23-8]
MDTSVVYIVDDDEGARTSLAWLLNSVNIRTACFPGAAAFLDAYDAQAPACLVLDVRMPEISGFQLQERLKALGSELPIIFVSGHGDIPMSVRALRAGAVDFFEKPYNSQQILDRIQLVLGDEEKRFPERAKRIELREKLKHLSPREREVLDGMLRGDASKVIARALNISARTVDVHRAAVKEKLGCHSSAGLVRDVVLAFGPGILTQVGGKG